MRRQENLSSACLQEHYLCIAGAGAQVEQKIPPLKFIEQHVKPAHPPIASMLKDNYGELARAQAEAKEKEWKGLKDDSSIPRSYRPF